MKSTYLLIAALLTFPLYFSAQQPAGKKLAASTKNATVKNASTGNATEEDCHCGDENQYNKANLMAQNTVAKDQKANQPSGAKTALPKYLNPSVPIEERINDLIPRLTLEEKVIQLSDSWGSKGIARLKVPAMLKTEGLHSQSYSTGATLFPHAISMATTFNADLIQAVGLATAVEAKAANLRCSWSPVLDVARDARWGRVEETYGEDPYLVSRMGVSWIKGFQSQNMIAVPKHFAGHGEPLGGRDSHDVGLSDRVMRNVHLVPFRAAIKEAHAGGVMAAYSTWNAVPDNGSEELLQKILRQEWGFDGYVVSDCSGPENILNKQNVVTNLEEACRMAIFAGVDVECGSAYVKALASAVQKGVLKESDLDDNLRRVFRAKFRLGLFDNPSSDKMVWDKLPAYDTPEHRALAREVSIQGSVLLKNDNNLLPLNKNVKSIAVIGPNANVAQMGDYSPKALPGQLITVLQGVKSHVGPQTQVLYAKGCGVLTPDTLGFAEAVAAAKKADVVVMVVGDYSTREFDNTKDKEKTTTGENVDGATLEIPGVQRQLIKRIQAVGKPVVLVLVNGKPFTLAWEAENIPAILETWYPGEEGGNATADLIFGDRNPSGRLPITLPRHVGQLPLYYNYLPSGRNYDYFDMPFAPLYRFGYGLSYTSFKYSNLKVVAKKDDPGSVTVSVDIENTGSRDGDEVAQLYLTDVYSSVITPVIELKGFKRVSLKKGEKKSVSFELTPYDLSLLNAGMFRVLEAGKFRVHVGGISPEAPAGNREHKQKIGFTDPAKGISGEFEVAKRYEANFKYSLAVPEKVRGGESFSATVTIKNEGNLLDIADIRLYGESLLDTRRFEIAPGETKTYKFTPVIYNSGKQMLTVIVGSKAVSRVIEVSRVPAKLTLQKERTTVGTDGVLTYTADASNTGSDVYTGTIGIKVEDKVVASQILTLNPGEQKKMSLTYSFPRSGTFRVKVGNASEQQMVISGGVALALQDPMLYFTFDAASASGVKDEVSGSILPVQGKPQFIPGKTGQAFKTDDKATFVKAGGADLYRKSFTLSGWFNIEKLENGQAMFFGGQAPMGADVDNTGTVLAAGISGEKMLLSFQDRDIQSAGKIETGKWIHLAYTYDAKSELGSLYINGKLDKAAAQKTYAGPLDMIGSSSRFMHGKFAMDEVLVTRNCMNAVAIKELSSKGIEALRNGQITTQWRSISGLPATLQTWADVPAGSSVKIAVEIGDQDGKVIDTKVFDVKSGELKLPLAGIKSGKQVRLNVKLSSSKWTALPVLQTAILLGSGEPVRWSTSDEWGKGTATGGLKTGL
ncbi:MAG: glycoside hydrolase family 3 N-terminal domain-containing protein [Bacteroidales bacterium]|nr:glycoside hydrolase family 3 N-terminal domain-containing protein [Bacteroidales bacterium]